MQRLSTRLISLNQISRVQIPPGAGLFSSSSISQLSVQNLARRGGATLLISLGINECLAAQLGFHQT